MNWLAHALLSDDEPEARLGNLLADLVKGTARAAMGERFQLGVRLHQTIDAFTDSHPIVRQSRRRLGEGYRHTRGIIIDIFYDHFLARRWSRYHDEPLADFTAGIYADVQILRARLPRIAQMAVDRMCREDWLGSYRSVGGIETALRRVSRRLSARLGKPFALERASGALVENFEELERHFSEFFPLLRTHVVRTIQDVSPERPPHPASRSGESQCA